MGALQAFIKGELVFMSYLVGALAILGTAGFVAGAFMGWSTY